MVDLNIPRSALDGVFAQGVFGAAGDPGVNLSERRDGALLDLSTGAPTGSIEETRRAIATHFGVDLPAERGQTAASDNCRALWIGPGHWLIKTAPKPGLEQAWADAAPNGAVNDVTHGRIVLRIKGPRAREILAKGCPLDLHPTAFPTNACAQSLMGKINVTLDCLDADDFEIITGRAYAKSLWAWITDAAAEYGYRIE
jgi:methylglutamate dehydrogenase subunit D